MIFKCKMCGGDLDIVQDMRVCECQYCGSKQTLPKFESDRRNNMLDRAGHFRRNNEYDKAMSLYEQILNEEAEDAEVYWSLVLCRYGIEYVEDPVSHRRMPTMNRVQYQSILADEDYKSALKYAEGQQRVIYENEAKEIERIQKGILAISSKEEPFDVFICYKESDESGRRTPDSVLANDLYHQLTQEGFKVFFARITLEDKLGSAYEPYIFAALNSAKVMVVLGTKPEYFNAVWVRNEWSRYLSMIKAGENKVLIPAYKDMDPYDLPEAFAHLQAQDMSKLGFMQDLIRGIKKLTQKEQKTEINRGENVSTGNGTQALVERAFLFLEDGDFERADELCEQALNQDPKNAAAYVGKLMAERKVKKQEELSCTTEELTENNYFQKALRFAEDGLKNELERCNQMIMDRNKDQEYESVLELVKQSGVSGGIEAAISILTQAIGRYEDLVGWKDSEAKLNECRDQRTKLVEELYERSHMLQEEGEGKKVSTDTAIQKLEEAVKGYRHIADLYDVGEELEKSQTILNQLYGIKRNRILRKAGTVLAAVFGAAVVIFALTTFIKNKQAYKEAYNEVVAAVEEGDYDLAYKAAGEKITEQQVNALLYEVAEEKLKNGEYAEAEALFERICEYEDYAEKVKEAIYQQALYLMEAGEYGEAAELFDGIIEYGDSAEQKKEAIYQQALSLKEAGEYEEAEELFKRFIKYEDNEEKVKEVTYQRALCFMEAGKYAVAEKLFESILEYGDSAEKVKETVYQQALGLVQNKKYTEAIKLFESIMEYEDSAEKKKEATYGYAQELFANGEYAAAEDIFRELSGYRASDDYLEVAEITQWATLSPLMSPSMITLESVNFRLVKADGSKAPEQVVLPDKVTEIGEHAFGGCSSITSITIPEGVTSIGEDAFNNCSSLISITIPGSITEIGEHAFQACSSITSITIPGSVTKIGEHAFQACTSLTSVTIPEGVTKIEDGTFRACSSLTSVIIPGSVTAIGDDVFRNCSSLTNITIPGSVTEIGERAFYECSSLTGITIEEGVTEIGKSAFYECSSLTSVTIPEGVTAIRERTFDKCSSLSSIVIPESVTKIEAYAFSGCASLTSVIMPEGVTEIKRSAFDNTPLRGQF